jgi:hypothetical protein
MVKINNFFFLFLCLLGSITYAQKVSNVTFRQEQSNIIVSYDLETKTPCKISLFVSIDDGKSWQGPLKKVTGDVGAKIASGNHSITWNVLEEFEELRGDKIKFQVRADADDLETVIIGTQEWTVKNLNVSTYRNGDIIPEVKDPTKWANLKTGAWCYYNNDPKNGEIYGKLYNWYAVNDRRGLAPEGFHIPSISELDKVTNLQDSTGFNARPGGGRGFGGPFNGIGGEGNWWSSSVQEGAAWFRNMNYNYGYDTFRSNYNKAGGFSVRFIRD